MIRIAIVEDDLESEQVLRKYLKRYEQEHQQSFHIETFTDGIEIVSDYRPLYDIVFLDIQMQHIDGLSAAHRIREVDKDVILIFITNMAQYAMHGYKVDALSYLLKPVPYFAFSQELKRGIEKLSMRKMSYLMVPVEGGIARVNVATIYYVESNRHNIIIHVPEGTYSFTGTLKDIELQLQGSSFFRCNKCYLINLAYVERVVHPTVVVAGHELLISRARKKAFLAALTDYVGGFAK